MPAEASSKALSKGAEACKRKMEAERLPQPVIQNFLVLYQQIEEGRTGIITEEEISPVPELPRYEDLVKDERYRTAGQKALSQLVVCKLNGGLGTSMGLERAKTLLKVKEDLTFNDVIAEQLMHVRAQTGQAVPLIHMTSFSTEDDIRGAMQKYPELAVPGLPINFNQHKHPKVYVDGLMPAQEPDDALNWNPPGHGDIYAALLSTGMLDKLLASGKRYIFVANADNLGATADPAILGFLAANNIPFLVEVAIRTAADRKGGHLASRNRDKRLILREGAQAPQVKGEPSQEFQDTERYRYFNANSLWGNLAAWKDAAEKNGGVIPLSLIRNEKTVNPRDSKSKKVYQIETAMGAAIEVFQDSSAVVIPRTRFSPVKTTTDLLAVRSDAYVLQKDKSLALKPEREGMGPPVVTLDSKYYKLVDEMDKRFPVVPSLLRAKEFKVEGNVAFTSPLRIEGKAVITDKRTSQQEPVIFDRSIAVLKDERVNIIDGGFEKLPLAS